MTGDMLPRPDDGSDDDDDGLGLNVSIPPWASSVAHVAKMALLVAIPVVALMAVVFGMVQAFGILATVLYLFVFTLGLSFIPVTVFMFGPSFPDLFKTIFGSLHFVLGQTAYERGVLVEFDDRYEMCPAERDAVFVDGEWHEVEGGLNNWSILGWQPFALLRWKDAETWQRKRADPAAEARQMSDGGRATTERGGFGEHRPDPTVTGDDGTWLLDLKRVFTRGIDKMGDTAMLEKAEEIAARKEAQSSGSSAMNSLVGSAIGLIMGAAIGYVMLIGF